MPVDHRLQLTGRSGDESGEPFGAAIARACCRNLFRASPDRGGAWSRVATARQATVACLPQSRARQGAAGHVTIESSTRCTCLLRSPNCWKLLHRRQNTHPAFPPLPDGHGSVGAGWEVIHVCCDSGNTPESPSMLCITFPPTPLPHEGVAKGLQSRRNGQKRSELQSRDCRS